MNDEDDDVRGKGKGKAKGRPRKDDDGEVASGANIKNCPKGAGLKDNAVLAFRWRGDETGWEDKDDDDMPLNLRVRQLRSSDSGGVDTSEPASEAEAETEDMARHPRVRQISTVTTATDFSTDSEALDSPAGDGDDDDEQEVADVSLRIVVPTTSILTALRSERTVTTQWRSQQECQKESEEEG